MGVNYAGLHYPDPIDHLVSIHSDRIGLMGLLRQAQRPQGPIRVHAPEQALGVTDVHPWGHGLGGTSSLFAALLGLELGYDKVVLAGVPLDGSNYFYGPPGEKSISGSDTVKNAWAAHLPKLNHRVVSCSGWTRALLGGPNGPTPIR